MTTPDVFAPEEGSRACLQYMTRNKFNNFSTEVYLAEIHVSLRLAAKVSQFRLHALM